MFRIANGCVLKCATFINRRIAKTKECVFFLFLLRKKFIISSFEVHELKCVMPTVWKYSHPPFSVWSFCTLSLLWFIFYNAKDSLPKIFILFMYTRLCTCILSSWLLFAGKNYALWSATHIHTMNSKIILCRINRCRIWTLNNSIETTQEYSPLHLYLVLIAPYAAWLDAFLSFAKKKRRNCDTNMLNFLQQTSEKEYILISWAILQIEWNTLLICLKWFCIWMLLIALWEDENHHN